MAYESGAETLLGSERSSRAVLAAGTLVASVATAGSLYLSLGLGLIPCELCWYQRILMYPLVVVLGVAFVKDDRSVYHTAVPLATVGAAIAAYHSYVQIDSGAGSCTVGCSEVQYTVVGLTVPNLSLVAFVLILLLMANLGGPFVGGRDRER